MLFLATFSKQVTYNPGDDGMEECPPTKEIRLVDADDAQKAAKKVLTTIEVSHDMVIRVKVTDLEITDTIR